MNGLKVFLLENGDGLSPLSGEGKEHKELNIKNSSEKRNMIIGQNGKAQSSGTYAICVRTNEYSLGL